MTSGAANPTRQAVYEAEVRRLWTNQSDSAHDLGHLRRVWSNARILALGTDADLDVLEAAAFLHDLVNPPKSSPLRPRASTLSAEAASRFLTTTDFPPARIQAVAHAIAAHSFSAGIAPETDEAKILQDADRLDALGAIGLARMFAVAGSMGTALLDPDDPLARARPLDDRAFALDHLETKLLTLPATMQTEAGRAMAEERAEWMYAFRSRLLRELP
jgi:uncharacterized protein